MAFWSWLPPERCRCYFCIQSFETSASKVLEYSFFGGVSRGILLKDECEWISQHKNSWKFPFFHESVAYLLDVFCQGQHLAFGQTHRNGERYPERRSTALGAGGLDGDGWGLFLGIFELNSPEINEMRVSTALKINGWVPQSHEGLVQIIFFSFHRWWCFCVHPSSSESQALKGSFCRLHFQNPPNLSRFSMALWMDTSALHVSCHCFRRTWMRTNAGKMRGRCPSDLSHVFTLRKWYPRR